MGLCLLPGRRRRALEVHGVRRLVVFVLAFFLSAAPAYGVGEAEQIQLLRQAFRLPQPEWPALLEENKNLLDDSFFQRCEARIKWGVENNQIEDAIRFALVADTALRVIGQPGRYSWVLRRAFRDGPEVGFPNYHDGVVFRTYDPAQLESASQFGLCYVEDIDFPGRRPVPVVAERTRAAAAVFFQQAEHRREEGRWSEARRAYTKGLRVDPSYIEGHARLGEVLLNLGELDLAIESLVKSVNYTSSDPSTWRCLGQAYESRFDKRGDIEDAKLASFAFLLGARLAPGDPRFMLDLRRACGKRWGVKP